eukprot:m.779787 g.779787  ORF g.779787 m.779787 type:complete len:543 (-) comp23279_c0_seq11:3341-4969(-)
MLDFLVKVGMLSITLVVQALPAILPIAALPPLDVQFTNVSIDLNFGGLSINGPPCLGWYNPAEQFDSSTNTYFSSMKTMSGTSFGNWSIKFDPIPHGSHDLNMTLQFNLTSNSSEIQSMKNIFFIPFGCKHGSGATGIQWPPNTALRNGYYNGNNGADAPAVLLIDYGSGSMIPYVPGNVPNITFGTNNGNPYGWQLTVGVSEIYAGKTMTVPIAVRFNLGSTTTQEDVLASLQPVFDDFREKFPMAYTWSDRRPVAMMFVASGQYATSVNPNGYHGAGPAYNLTTRAGVEAFRAGMLQSANTSAQSIMQRVGENNVAAHPQAVIVWDIEGESDPWATYVGAPNMLKEIAPHMNDIADEFLAVWKDAGFRIGLTLRPQELVENSAWNKSVPVGKKPFRWIQRNYYRADNSTDEDAYVKNLAAKASYAINRWNVSVFYVDTVGNKNGLLPYAIFKRLKEQFPSVLWIPEGGLRAQTAGRQMSATGTCTRRGRYDWWTFSRGGVGGMAHSRVCLVVVHHYHRKNAVEVLWSGCPTLSLYWLTED